MKKSYYILITLIGLAITTIPLCLHGSEYDYYVDESVSESGNGSETGPFKTINEAIKMGGKIFIEDGEYEEDLKIGEGSSLHGESENSVIISGKITMEGDTFLKDITARDAKTVITVEKDADVEIENCTIEDFERIGIETLAGSGKLEITDSKIKKAKGKGFYIQRGKTIEILNSEIERVDEEGIDIRSKVSGLITGNNISKNGESGIELIVGDADLKIKNNTIKRNGSSGIATQFYPDSNLNNRGKIEIEDNSIGYNNKYGLDCNRPQGGSPEKDYWKDSIELEGNNIHDNQKEVINDYCCLFGAVDKNKESDNIMIDRLDKDKEDEAKKDEIEPKPELMPEEKERIRLEAEAKEREKEQKINKIKSILRSQSQINFNIEKNLLTVKKEKKIRKFFLGPDEKIINNLNSKFNLKQSQLEQADRLINETDLDADEEMVFQKSIEEEKEIAEQHKKIMTNEKKSFSLFGWLKDVFGGLFFRE